MAITVVLTFLAAFILFALALDAGIWYFDHRTAQNQVDAASLAGAGKLAEDADDMQAAADEAVDWLQKNGSSIAELYPCPGAGWTASSYGEGVVLRSGPNGGYDAVKVCVRRDSLIVFSGLANLAGVKVSAGAAAALLYEPALYSLMAMNPDGCPGDGMASLNLAGQAVVNILGDGGSYTRSPCDGALFIDGGNTTFFAGGDHHVVGSCAPTARCDSSQVTPDPTNNFGTLIDDPWEEYDQPTPGACRTDLQNEYTSGTWNLPPGTYCIPLRVSSTATVRLLEGTHIFRQGLMVSGNSPRLESQGRVLIYMTCAAGASCGGAVPPQAPGCSTAATFCLQGGSGSSIDLTGPTSEPKAVIWVDRTAGAYNTPMVRIAGQGVIAIDGNIYAISSTVQLQGQGGAVVELNGTVIADKIHFSGQATYNVTWDAELAPKIVSLALIE
jgi:hypothetical protein